jgi:hypothetical protein
MSFRVIFFLHRLVLFELLICQGLDLLDNRLKTGSCCKTLNLIPHNSGAISEPGLSELSRESGLLDLVLRNT